MAANASYGHRPPPGFENQRAEESDGGNELENLELEFTYTDCDTLTNEIAELYSYTEVPEFHSNVKAFEGVMEEFNLPPSWQKLNERQQMNIISKLMDSLETAITDTRMSAARCVLYLAQGCWAEVQSDTEQQHWARYNVMLLFEMGIYSQFIELLNFEMEKSCVIGNSSRKIAESIGDSTNLRVILSVLYIITEYMRVEKENPDSEYNYYVQEFKEELGSRDRGDELLVIKLLGMVTQMCAGTTPHFPIKKVLLLLWKVLLVYLGGTKELKEMKARNREKYGLPPIDEDNLEIVKMLRSSSPPLSAADMLENQNLIQKKGERSLRRQTFVKQTSLDEAEEQNFERENSNNSDDYNEYSSEASCSGNPDSNYSTNQFDSSQQNETLPVRVLPWKPKVRQRDIDMFLENVRMKFVGFSLPGDRTTLAGLPLPIHESIRILKSHIYTNVGDIQIEREMEIARNPLTKGEKEIEETEAEILYKAMLPNLPQYMIALLKILLAAAPTSAAKTYSINITADVLPEEMPMTIMHSIELGVDVNRHKEIIIKSVTAILLLLLKHFKNNHVHQFEFMSQHLVYANCIPLVLKFFNQHILSYIGAESNIPILDFPTCVIGEQPEFHKSSVMGFIGNSPIPYSWRNLFSCINLLRILNKLTKWKSARIMMLLVFKSAPILKRTLKVRQALMQFYILKLLKMQTKYLGRQWRKTNMKTISAIYSKVRHRLNDDWAFGNDVDVRPWDFQEEECSLRMWVDRFNQRRYGPPCEVDIDLIPLDNDINTVLDINIELDDDFKNNYKKWLEDEVYNNEIDWDVIIGNSEG